MVILLKMLQYMVLIVIIEYSIMSLNNIMMIMDSI